MDFSLTDEQELGIKRGKEWLKNNIQRPFVIMGCAGCLDKDTRILTSEGYMTLEEIFKYTNSPMNEIGEHQVETSLKIFNGEKFTDMTKTHVTTKMKGYKITLNSGIEIISSHKHKFKTINNGKLKWIKADNLKENDYIASLGNKIIFENNNLNLDYYYMGYYHADGYFYKNTFNFYSKNEEKLIELKKYFNINSSIRYYEKKNIYRISFVSEKFKNMTKNIGLDVKNKIIPLNILNDSNKRFSYLKGLFNDIGISKNGIITFSSLHKENVIYVMEMCKEFGIIFGNLKEKKNNHGLVYQITMMKDSIMNFYNIFGNIIGKKNGISLESFINKNLNTNLNIIPNISKLYDFKSNRKINNELHQSDYKNNRRKPSYKQLKKLNEIYYKNNNNDLNEILEKKYYFDKIVKIEKVFQRFYDITVPESHCYIANGILSHNSGKSTLIKYLIEEMKLDDDEVYYCTFTGKAAQVLCQKGLNATTIHKLIYNPIVNEKTGEINFVLKESIPEYIKFIVLDEFYMINQKILDDLLSFGRKVIALGDNNQLPPPMNKPNNLDNNPDIVLTKPMRQSLDSPIIYLAYKAMKKENIEYGSYGDNVKVVTRDQLKEDYFLYDQIIAGKNATVQKLNNFYRKNILCTDSKIPIKGDKLMCLRNNWDISIIENKIQTPLINGMVGYLESDITEDSRIDYLRTSKIDFRPEFFKDTCFKNIYMDLCIFEDNLMKEPDYNDEKYMEIMKKRNIFKKSSLSRINYFNYGYVCTCYKAQGSEFNKVFFIQENLGNRIYWSHLYTGITRAKEKLILVL